MSSKVRTTAVTLLIAALAVLSAIFFTHNTDFQVYWYGIRKFVSGGPLYGPHSGIGYPQEFRYPPVTVLFFLPLTWPPLRVASFLWTVGAWAVCAAASALAIRKWRLTFSPAGAVLGLILLAPFAFLAVKFGNVQPYLVALILLGLLWAEEHPAWSGAALAIAICFKVWPLFFAPWFLLRRRILTLFYACAGSIVLWASPIVYFGWRRYVELLQDFLAHVYALASNPETVWYSGQSLRGVAFRFLTHATPPRDGYPDMSFAALSPALVGDCCLALSVIIYGWAVYAMWRAPESRRFLWDSIAFVLFSILQPFALNSGLISLLPAILTAAHVFSNRRGFSPAARHWFVAAVGFSILSSITFYRPFQRATLMLGVDFWIMLALGVSLIFAARSNLDSAKSRS